MQISLGWIRAYGRSVARPASKTLESATAPIVESLERRALLSGTDSVEVRTFESTSDLNATQEQQIVSPLDWDQEVETTTGDSQDGSGDSSTGDDRNSSDGNTSGDDSSSDDSGAGSTPAPEPEPAPAPAPPPDSGDDSGNDSGSGTDSAGGNQSGSHGWSGPGDDGGGDSGSGDSSSDGGSDSDGSGTTDGSTDSGSGSGIDDSGNGGGEAPDPGTGGAGSDSGSDSGVDDSNDSDDSSGDDNSSGEDSSDDDDSGGSDTGAGDSINDSDKKDKTRPTADIKVSDVHDAGDGTLSIKVVYSDNIKVKAKSIKRDDLALTGPGGDLKVTGVSISPDSDAGKIAATYTIAAPGGSWDDGDNGRYTVEVKDGAVVDSSGNEIRSASASFDVRIDAPPAENPAPDDDNSPPPEDDPTPDVNDSAPAVRIETSDLHSNDDAKVIVHFTDDGGINLGSIDRSNLTVSGPGGPSIDVGVVDVDSKHHRTDVTVTYHLSAPGGSWDANDNGTYSVTLKDHAVEDNAGNGTRTADASFKVDCPAPPPVDTGFGNGGNNSGGNGNQGGGNTGGGNSGGGGDVVGTTGPINFVAESVITQGDGKILLAGHAKASDGSDQAVLRRFNADGTLDTTFGDSGSVTSGAGESWYVVTMQGADRIIVAGTLGGDFIVNRYDLAGHLDTNFGEAGHRRMDFFGADDTALAAAIGAGNTIVVGGSSNGNAAFTRLTADGALDGTFGQDGQNLFDLGTADDAIAGIAVQSDGRIVGVGATETQVAVIRLGTDGEADRSFSGDGLLLVSSVAAAGSTGKIDHSQGVALDSNGKILLANHSAGGDFAMTRIDTNGNVDSSFGENGVRTIDMGGDDDADAIVIQETGEILVIGTSLVGGGSAKTAVAALDIDGSLISSFGDNGKLLLDAQLAPTTGRELHVGDLVLRAFGARQPDGKLVIGTSNGTTATSGSATSPLRRLIVPGSQALPQGSKIGDFGMLGNGNQRLQFTDDDGTTVVLNLKGGSGTAWKSGNKINLVLNDGGPGLALTLKISGGDGRITLGDVTVGGSLKSLKGKAADLTGVFCTTGQIGKLTVGNIAGATLCAGGSIASIAAASITGAKVLAGTALGADARLGGAGSNADQVGPATVGTLKITGQIKDSIIGAGLDAVDGTYGDDDDRVVGGSTSLIRSITAKGGTVNSHFLAGAFGTAKTPAKVDVSQDPQFQVM